MIDTPVVILCGGLGTRLRSVVHDVPKVLAEISGRPFLAHLLDRLGRQGVREVLLSTGYRSELLQQFVDSRPADGMNVICIPEQQPLGTGGALRFVYTEASLTSPFIALNGDTFFSGALDELLQHHLQNEAVGTLAVVEMPSAERYGTVRFQPRSGIITSFQEKSARPGPAWINAGAYVLEPALMESVAEGLPVSLEREVLPEWVGRGLFACPFPEAQFLDIGTPEDYTRAQHVLG